MSSGIRTNNERTQLAGKYTTEKSIATEYVDVVTIVRLPALFPIKAGTVSATYSTMRIIGGAIGPDIQMYF